MDNKEKSIIKTDERIDQPMPLIQMAIEKGAAIETLERLMSLQERWEASKAKKAFNEAMANFQGNCPVIKRKKDGGKTDSGMVAYKYAELGTIVDQVRSLLQKYGLSYSIKTTFAPNKVTAICIAKHLAGHSEESEVEMPLATKTKIMNDPQQIGATITYAKRYAFCNAFGIMTEGEDVDGRGTINNQSHSTPKRTVEEVLGKIKLSKTKEDIKKWREWIPSSGYNQVQQNLMNRVLEEVEKSIK